MLVAIIILLALVPFVFTFGIIYWAVVVKQNPVAASLIRSVALGLIGGVVLGAVISLTLLLAVLGLVHLRGHGP